MDVKEAKCKVVHLGTKGIGHSEMEDCFGKEDYSVRPGIVYRIDVIL